MRCPTCGFENRPDASFCTQCGSRLHSSPVEDIEVHVEGEISGQVAVGNHLLQIGDVHGGVVNIALPEYQPRPQPRPTPIFLRPRPFPDFLDREKEIDAAISALQSATPVAFCGQSGIGKTSLLRHLAHHPAVASFLDGVVYLSIRGQSVQDLLQSLFDAFYESDVPFKPTDAQVWHGLQDKQALIILDDVELARDEVEMLIDRVPTCGFLLASLERRLWREEHVLELQGLSLNSALVLVEQEFGRSLSPRERPAAQELCTFLEGHPQRILQVVRMAQEGSHSLTEVVRLIQQTPSPEEAVTAQALASLSQTERQVLTMLATVGDVPVQADNQISLTGLPNVASILEALQRRGLVETDHTRYSLVGTLDQILQQEQDLTPWVDRALSEYVPWAEEHRSEPKRLLEEANAILRLSEWANRAGHWRQVLRLVRAVEGALALGGRWNDWTQVLQLGYQAAQMLDDQTEEAWALHQLGVCAHTMGNVTEARAYLSQALRLRETLGDQIGAAVTRTNLNRIQSDDVPRESLEYAMPAAAVEESKGSRPLRVFLCHTSGDKPVVRDLYHRLRADGIDPWLDEENLVAGQEWQLEIPKAVRASDVVIICISRKSITKAGYVQEEIKYALDVADEQPEGAIFLIPLKLEECQVPERLRRWHYVKLFTEKGYSRLMRALRKRAREVGATVERQPAAPAETKVSGEEELEGSNKFELELASLRRQLAEAEENLRLIQERKSQYVLEVDIPLQLVKEEQRLSKHIGELKQRVGELG